MLLSGLAEFSSSLFGVLFAPTAVLFFCLVGSEARKLFALDLAIETIPIPVHVSFR